MANFKPHRFSNPSTLKSITRPLLVELLHPHQAFLGNRRFAMSDPDALDYEALAAILMTPNSDTPSELAEALYFIDEMATPHGMDAILNEAAAIGLDLTCGAEWTPADVAVRFWLKDRHAFERLHAEQFLTKPRSFESFQSIASPPRKPSLPSGTTLQALEKALNDWFETRQRGRGTRVFPYSREDGVWFLVRHGEPYKREGALENGQPVGVFYRPERFDVLRYNPKIGELSVHARTKGEKELYRKQFGLHLFGNPDFFPAIGQAGKYTLEPLRHEGRLALVCADLPGIEYVTLGELHFYHSGVHGYVEVIKSQDVFDSMEEFQRTMPRRARLTKAAFKVKFAHAARPRTVTIRPPNVALFDRESDSELVETWLRARGFVQPTIGGEADEEAQPVLAVS